MRKFLRQILAEPAEKPMTLRLLLKSYNIPLIKFIFFYLSVVSKACFKFWYQYFRYFMLIIWRRTFLLWVSVLSYFKIDEKLLLGICAFFKDFIINIPISWQHQCICILACFLLVIFRHLIIFIYKYLFNYRDILNFNKEVQIYYAENIAAWMLKNRSEIKENPVITNNSEIKENPVIANNIEIKENPPINEISRLENENRELKKKIKTLYSKSVLNNSNSKVQKTKNKK